MKIHDLSVGEMAKAVELLGVRFANKLDDLDLNGDISQLDEALEPVGYAVDRDTMTITRI